MKQRFGRCFNFDGCALAEKKELIPIAVGSTEFTCPECGKPLSAQRPSSPPIWPWILAGTVAVVLILGFVAWRVLGALHGQAPSSTAPPPTSIATAQSTSAGAPASQPLATPTPTVTASPTARRTAVPKPSPTRKRTAPPATPRPNPSVPHTIPPTHPPKTVPPRTPRPQPTHDGVVIPAAPSIKPTEIPPTVPPPLPTASSYACAAPNVPASVAVLVTPKYPKSEIGSRLVPVVDVKVNVDQNGQLSHVEIARSSGNKAFDDAALESAVRSSYSAPIVGCVAQAGTLTLHVDFSESK